MTFSEEQLESLSQKIEEHERRTRRRAWLVTVIPIISAGVFLVYTIQQISTRQEELNQKTSLLVNVNAEIPVKQATLAAAETANAQLQTELSQKQDALATADAALATATAQFGGVVDARRSLVEGSCRIDDMVLKEYASNDTHQVTMLIFLLRMQHKNILWNPNGFSETDGFDSPNFALYALQNAIPGIPLASMDYKPGTRPWNFLKPISSPSDGDIIYYKSGYTMFYYELPTSYGSQNKMECVIGMTPLGVLPLQMDFADRLGALKVPYP